MSTYGDDPSQPGQPHQPTPAPAPLGEQVSFGGEPPTGPPVPPGSEPAVPGGHGAPRKRRRLAIAAGIGGAVLLIGGGAAVWAVSSFLSGGGAQPESVVPASAIGFVRVDTDPSAGQKIAAYKFLRKFPSVGDGVGDGDLVDNLLDKVFEDDENVTYARDVKPWLGKRAGVAAVPNVADGNPQTLVVVQVKDEAKAKASLRKLLDDQAENSSETAFTAPSDDVLLGSSDVATTPGTPQGLVVRDGWALIGPDQVTTEAMSADAATASLKDAPKYVADMKTVGDVGIASGWADLDAVAASAKTAADPTSGLVGLGGAGTGGRVVGVVKIDGDAVVLTAHQSGGTAATVKNDAPGGPLLQNLPADTTGAVAVGNASATIAQAFDSIDKTVGADVDFRGEIKKAVGLDVPADLEALFGTGFAVVVGDVTAESPQIAVRVRTTDPAGSRAVLDKAVTGLEKQASGFLELPDIADYRSSDGIVYALTPAYAQLVGAGGTLGQNPDFVAALPDAATASTAGYVSFARIAALTPDPEVKKNLAALRSLGFSARTTASGSDMTVRLVAR